jgi:dynein light intermediate chain 2
LEGHEDASIIKPLPIETIIVGCKYDELEKEDSENRKWLSRAVRYMANVNFCHLFYCSAQNPTVVSQIRNVFSEVLFGSKRTYYSQKDHLKPIFISQGQDTIQNLNIGGTSVNLNILEVIKKQIGALFVVDEGDAKKQGAQIDITKYSEGRIDSLIEERKKLMLKITKGAKDSLGIRAR